MLQAMAGLRGQGLYISGEESLQQVKDRAHRLQLKVPIYRSSQNRAFQKSSGDW